MEGERKVETEGEDGDQEKGPRNSDAIYIPESLSLGEEEPASLHLRMTPPSPERIQR